MKRLFAMMLAATMLITGCGGARGEIISLEASTPAAAESTTQAAQTLPSTDTETAVDTTATFSEETIGTETVETETEAAETTASAPGETQFVTPDFYTGKRYRISSWLYEEEDPFYLTEEGYLLDGSKLPEELADVLTDEVNFYCRRRYEAVSEGQYNLYETLYDREGNVLEEEGLYSYGYSIGNLIVRRNSMLMDEEIHEESVDRKPCLYNPLTHETVIEGAAMMWRLSQEKAIVCDSQGIVMGVIDAQGNKLMGFPMDEKYIWPDTYPGVVILRKNTTVNNEEIRVPMIFDQEMNLIMEADTGVTFRTMDCKERGMYLIADNDITGISKLYDISDSFREIAIPEGSIGSLDGKHLIISRDDKYFAYDMAGNLIIGEQEYIDGLNDEFCGEFRGFFVKNPDRVLLYNLDGSVKAQREIDSRYDTNVYAYRGIVNISYSYTDANGDYQYVSEYMNEEFEDLLPEGKGYTSISKVTDEINALSRSDISGFPKVDLVDNDGNVIANDVICYAAYDDGKLAIFKGHWVGFIDGEGNWIIKNSIYSIGQYD